MPPPDIDPSEPRLAPPGAGLPRIELLVGRTLFRLRRWRGDAAAFTADFVAERARVGSLIGGLDDAAAARRVLIARIRGLEDSSRFWSVWMTLDHLRIVHRAIAGVLRELALGRTPPGAASTAAVKPSAEVDGAVVADYERSCDELLAAFPAAPRATPSYPHPWFGPLDAAGWHALAGTHLRIHREQIERILSA